MEPARRLAARRGELRADDRLDRARHGAPSRLRLRTVGRRADRHTLRRRRRRRRRARTLPSTTRTSRTSSATRSRPRCTSKAGAVGRRPARAAARQGHVPALRAVRALPERQGMEGRVRRDVEPALEHRATGRVDVGRRGGAADLPGAGALRRGRTRRHRPRAALHRVAHAQGVCLPGAALRLELGRSVAAADGPARAAEGERRHLGLPASGAHRAPGAEDATG